MRDGLTDVVDLATMQPLQEEAMSDDRVWLARLRGAGARRYRPARGRRRTRAKPVRIVVPFTAGSATDILARDGRPEAVGAWGQPVVIDNRPGAGGTIGAAIVAKSPGDGYTLLVHSAAHAYNPAIYPNLTYDTVKDFVEVVPLAGQPNVLVVAPSTGYQDGRRPHRCGEAEARSAQLRVGGQRQRNAHQRREIQARRRHRRACTFRTRARPRR